MSDSALPPTDSFASSSLTETTEATIETPAAAPTPSPLKSIMKKIAWSVLAIVCLVVFTLFKLPEEKLRSFIQGSAGAALASQGISFSATESHLSIGLGVSYTMKDVVLNFPPPQDSAKIEEISVSPSILSLFTGKAGGSLSIENRGGKLNAHFSAPLSTLQGASGGTVTLSFDVKSLDIGSMGLLPLLANGVKGSAVANGTGDIQGDPNIPSSLEGQIQLDLSRIVIDAQTYMGFSIPRLSISEGKLDVAFNKGKATIRTLRLGKAGNASDDIQANLTGDMTLGRNWPSSTLNAKATFTLSKNILNSFALIDAILQSGKRPDGSYGFQLAGPVGNLMPTPLPQ